MENNTTETPSRRHRALARLSVVGGTLVALVGLVAGSASAVTSLPSPSSVATTIVNTGGSQLVNTAVAVIPVIIGVLVIFWAINFALKKMGLSHKAGVK